MDIIFFLFLICLASDLFSTCLPSKHFSGQQVHAHECIALRWGAATGCTLHGCCLPCCSKYNHALQARWQLP